MCPGPDGELDLVARVRALREARRVAPSFAIAAQRTTGMAQHPGHLLTVATKKAVAAAMEPGPHHQAIRGAAMQAFCDGYVLAAALAGVSAAGQGKRFARSADVSRWLGKAVRAGAALLGGPLGPPARVLIDDWMVGLPPDVGEPSRRALANAMAAGMLLFVYEHGVSHPVFDALSAAARPARAVRTQAAPVRRAASPELLDAILADPDDDAARLVYADWLIEQGDPLGELIHIQCALGRALVGASAQRASRLGQKLPFDSRQELEARERELVKRHEKTWLAPIRPYIRRWTLRRGFVEHVEADIAAFMKGLPALARVPITSVKLTGMKASYLPAIEKAAPHPTVRRYDLSRNRLDPKATRIVAAPVFSRAATLDLSGNPISGVGVAALAEMSLPALARLRLAGVNAADRDMARLGEASFWPRLTHLDIKTNQGIAAETLAALPRARALEWLAIDELGSTLTGLLADLDVPRLHTLEVGWRTDEATLRILAHGAGLRALRCVHHSVFDLSPATRELLAARFPEPPGAQDPFNEP